MSSAAAWICPRAKPRRRSQAHWPTRSRRRRGSRSRRTSKAPPTPSGGGIACHGPFALYGGRIDPGKGCEELLEYFQAYVKEGGDATLMLMGVKLMPLPEDPHVQIRRHAAR